MYKRILDFQSNEFRTKCLKTLSQGKEKEREREKWKIQRTDTSLFILSDLIYVEIHVLCIKEQSVAYPYLLSFLGVI